MIITCDYFIFQPIRGHGVAGVQDQIYRLGRCDRGGLYKNRTERAAHGRRPAEVGQKARNKD